MFIKIEQAGCTTYLSKSEIRRIDVFKSHIRFNCIVLNRKRDKNQIDLIFKELGIIDY